MRPLIKHGSFVRVNQGLYEGVCGWVTQIEVEHTKETGYAFVWLTVELSHPYGQQQLFTSAMVDLVIKQQPVSLKKAA